MRLLSISFLACLAAVASVSVADSAHAEDIDLGGHLHIYEEAWSAGDFLPSTVDQISGAGSQVIVSAIELHPTASLVLEVREPVTIKWAQLMGEEKAFATTVAVSAGVPLPTESQQKPHAIQVSFIPDHPARAPVPMKMVQ